jgi:hypothetical protein
VFDNGKYRHRVAARECLVRIHESRCGYNSRVGMGMQSVSRAAFYTPDADMPRAKYYLAMLKNNMRVMEGFKNITGTALTPASINPTCSGYSSASANMWDWGRCSFGQNLAPSVVQGFSTGGEVTVNGSGNILSMTTANPMVVTVDTDPSPSTFDANIKWALAPRLSAAAGGGTSMAGPMSLSGSTRIQ